LLCWEALVLRQSLLNGVAIAAAAATVAMTVIASLTLLPALLSFTGARLARESRLNTFLGARCQCSYYMQPPLTCENDPTGAGLVSSGQRGLPPCRHLGRRH
jgi:uncharacterized membrane protein YdfJ with MMPL/SSD domain